MTNDEKVALARAGKIKAVVVEVECDHCEGRKRVPAQYAGSQRAQPGEVMRCPICDGYGVRRMSITFSLLYDLLNGNL